MSTLLITGGAGFIGSHLADLLAGRGDRVIVLDDLSGGSAENLSRSLDSGLVTLVQGSVTDGDLVDGCMEAADACVHLAARLGVHQIVTSPLSCLRENVLGADIVMEAAARRGKRLIFSSSSEVYGKLNQRDLSETSDRLIGSPAKSRWSYAIAKEFGESLAHAYVQQMGADMRVVRLFNTVGPRQVSKYGMVVARFVRQALDGEPLTVYGDGAQSRCFTDVRDVVRGLDLLLHCDRAAGGAYNIGTSAPISIAALAHLVLERTGSISPVVFVPYAEAHAPGFEELGNRSPDTTALRRMTGWTPRRSLEETIDTVIAYELDQALRVSKVAATGSPPSADRLRAAA
ncbi:MAG TPA: NAD-dependent epimerase/dehydratase family protein [Solirubrobacteraceae bacterium]|nr:NAD-dependent epimerase/dehydratase family protein [Solirubrobacteraceae bacterium]